MAETRPLRSSCQRHTEGLMIDSAHKVKMSPKRTTPRMDAATPRTAEEIMCVIGDVTWIDRAHAMERRNPTLPWARVSWGEEHSDRALQTTDQDRTYSDH